MKVKNRERTKEIQQKHNTTEELLQKGRKKNGKQGSENGDARCAKALPETLQ